MIRRDFFLTNNNKSLIFRFHILNILICNKLIRISIVFEEELRYCVITDSINAVHLLCRHSVAHFWWTGSPDSFIDFSKRGQWIYRLMKNIEFQVILIIICSKLSTVIYFSLRLQVFFLSLSSISIINLHRIWTGLNYILWNSKYFSLKKDTLKNSIRFQQRNILNNDSNCNIFQNNYLEKITDQTPNITTMTHSLKYICELFSKTSLILSSFSWSGFPTLFYITKLFTLYWMMDTFIDSSLNNLDSEGMKFQHKILFILNWVSTMVCKYFIYV